MPKVLAIFFCFVPLLSFSQISVVELEVRPIPEPYTRDTVVDRWNMAQPGYQKLSQQAKELFYWTNYCRNNPKRFWDSAAAPIIQLFPRLQTPEARSLEQGLTHASSLPMFRLNPILVKTAQSHAYDMAANQAGASHISTNGTDFATRMQLAGIRGVANENISISSQSILLSVILLYLDIDLPALGHRKTLLDPILREIGVGAALYGKDQWFLAQDFAGQQ